MRRGVNADNANMGLHLQRIRRYLGVKQTTLAAELGMSQPEISRLERQKVIDGERLQQISDILGISPEVIITFDVNKTISTINASPAGQNKRVTGKPDLSEKIVELYERLLESEREKGKLMEQHGETYRTKN